MLSDVIEHMLALYIKREREKSNWKQKIVEEYEKLEMIQ